jgi:membrane associated rhomboid family serine protease
MPICEHCFVSTSPTEPFRELVDEPADSFCYVHKDTRTGLACSRCGRPICGRCAIPASVGQHCPDCVAEARRNAPKVRSALQATAPGVRTIIILTVVFYFLQQFVPGLTRQLASFPPAVADGQLWRLITPVLLHAGLLHIAFNMYALYMLGPNIEQAFGTSRFFLIYLITGLAGSAASYAFGPCRVLGVGASGAVFGIAGTLLVYLYNRRTSTFVRPFLNNILFVIGANLVLGFVLPGIDNLAHMGGLVAGVTLGVAFDRSEAPRAAGLAQALSSVAVLAAVVALIAYRTTSFACF